MHTVITGEEYGIKLYAQFNQRKLPVISKSQ